MKRSNLIMAGVILMSAFVFTGCKEEEGETQKEPTASKHHAEIILNDPSGGNADPFQQEEKNTDETLDVAFIGEDWVDKTALNLLNASWDKALPESIRFVLIDHEEAISEEKQAQLKRWIETDKVVLFYGENVQPKEVKEKIGMEVGVIQVETDASFDFPYLLYGFGYSTTYEQYLPIFLGSNTSENMEKKIADFLLTNKNF